MTEFYDKRSTDIPEMDRRLSLVADLVISKSPRRVLDVACGRGALVSALQLRQPRMDVAGVELSPTAVAEARSRGLNVTQGDVTKGLPFADEHFDCVIFGEVIEHIVDPDAALRELGRVLRRNGTLIVTTPNLASWYNRVLLLLGIQPIFTETSLEVNLGRRFRALGQWRPTQGHLKIFTVSALREMLSANGFQTAAVYGAPFPEQTKLAMLDLLFCRVPVLASGIIAVSSNARTLQTKYPRLPGWH